MCMCSVCTGGQPLHKDDDKEIESIECKLDVYAGYAPNGDIHVSTSINQKIRKGE